MKNFQHSETREPESLAVPHDETSSAGNRYSAPLAGDKQTAADRVRHVCLHILLFLLTCHAVFGEVRNGYEKNIVASKQSLAILRARLLDDENMKPWERRKLEGAVAKLVDHVTYYDLTERMLLQFHEIVPELYAQIDTLADRLGRPVDVYVKFVPVDATSTKAWGLTYIGQSADDKDAYESEYGKYTVSVNVWIVRRALMVLAHELGHVLYQVPNLANYLDFYKNQYGDKPISNSLGHDAGDPSGMSALQFERIFQKSYAAFLRVKKADNPVNELAELRKTWSKNSLL